MADINGKQEYDHLAVHIYDIRNEHGPQIITITHVESRYSVASTKEEKIAIPGGPVEFLGDTQGVLLKEMNGRRGRQCSIGSSQFHPCTNLFKTFYF